MSPFPPPTFWSSHARQGCFSLKEVNVLKKKKTSLGIQQQKTVFEIQLTIWFSP